MTNDELFGINYNRALAMREIDRPDDDDIICRVCGENWTQCQCIFEAIDAVVKSQREDLR